MIDHIKIEGFKHFESNDFYLKNLSLLTGMNGSGKSSFIQALLLAKKSTHFDDELPLDNSYGVDLGTASNVINWNNNKINLTINSDCNFELTLPKEDSLYLNISKKEIENIPCAFSPEPRKLTYLCAERVGPRSSYPLLSSSTEQLEVGLQGENTTQLIEAFGNSLLPDPDRTHPLTSATEPKFLTYQIEKWLSEIVRPIEIKAERPQLVKEAVLSFKTQRGEWVRSTNMGFGVTYALPIILAGLIVPKDSLLIVENPEVHLHPAGQSRIGVFLGWLASKGVQVIVETHSDHVLNGVRRAIAEYKYLDTKDANVLFFDPSSENGTLTHLTFSPDGSTTNWPRNFFDQYQIDTAALGRIRRSSLSHVIRN